jgi:hypothetical protein
MHPPYESKSEQPNFPMQNAKSWPQAPHPGGLSRQLLDSACSHRKSGVLFGFGAWQTRGF